MDGVVSLDPVVLAGILSVTGAVTVDGIEVNADNAVDVLLSETYLRFPADQAPADAFFAATSATVFQKLVVGRLGPHAHARCLQRRRRAAAPLRVVRP